MPQVALTAIGFGVKFGMAATMATRAVNHVVVNVDAESVGGFQIVDMYARLAKLCPQIETAVAPEPATIGCGRQDPFGELERAVAAGVYKLRSGVANPAGLVGSLHCHGVSMGSVLPSGYFVWFDCAEPAQDGDLVVFRYGDAWLREAIATNLAGNENFASTYSGWTSNVGIKMLSHHRGRHVLHGVDDAVPMPLSDGHRVLGVVRHVRDEHGVECYV
jgi:hypothetical protein